MFCHQILWLIKTYLNLICTLLQANHELKKHVFPSTILFEFIANHLLKHSHKDCLYFLVFMFSTQFLYVCLYEEFFLMDCFPYQNLQYFFATKSTALQWVFPSLISIMFFPSSNFHIKKRAPKIITHFISIITWAFHAVF